MPRRLLTRWRRTCNRSPLAGSSREYPNTIPTPPTILSRRSAPASGASALIRESERMHTPGQSGPPAISAFAPLCTKRELSQIGTGNRVRTGELRHPLGSKIADRHIAGLGNQLAHQLPPHPRAAAGDNRDPTRELLHVCSLPGYRARAVRTHSLRRGIRPAAERLWLRAATRRGLLAGRRDARRPTDDGQPLGVKGAGQAGLPQTIIKAILDALASLDIDYIDCQPPPSGCGAHAARRRRARGRSDLLGPVAVGVGDYFHHVTVGVVEINAATAVQMIDLARLGAPRIGAIPDALRADAGERGVELGVADKEREMPRTKLFARIEIEGHSVRSLHRDEMAPFRSRFEIEDIGEEFGRDPFVLRRDDRVIEFDTLLVLPSRFLILSRHRPGRRDLAV